MKTGGYHQDEKVGVCHKGREDKCATEIAQAMASRGVTDIAAKREGNVNGARRSGSKTHTA